MWRGCLCLLVLLACSKDSNQKPDEKTDVPAAAPVTPRSDKSAADVMSQSIAEAKARAEAAAPASAPTTLPPVEPAPPVDPMPPETPLTPPGDAPEPAAPAADALKIGDRVMAKWTNGKWYPGRIVGINDDAYDVNYDDGDKSRGLPAAKVRKQAASKSSGGSRPSTSSSDAPCPGPGLTRRCNGRCVNIQTDDNHCGGCNNRCPAGKRCDGHMFCRDAAGNL